MSKSEKTTKLLFWLAFAAFLSTSIPHVAWVFFHYEPQHDGYALIWWGLSYAVAIGIDVLICWLSYMRAEQTQQGKSDGAITWVFIALLALLSWFCNWIFAETMADIDVWSIVLPFYFAHITVGMLTPFIVSALPLFVIAYSYMSRRILGAKVAEVSVDKLRQQAEDAEEIAGYRMRIASANKQQRDVAIDNGIATLKKLNPWGKKAKPEKTNDVPEMPAPGREKQPEGEQITEDLPEVPVEASETVKMEESGRETGTLVTLNEETMRALHLCPKLVPYVSKSQRTITIKEAAEATEYTEKWIRNRIEKHLVKVSSRNKNLVIIGSLITWLNSLPNQEQVLEKNTAKMPAITVDNVPATNGYH